MNLIVTQVLVSHSNQLFVFPGTPEPEVDWYKDNRVIREGGRIKFMFEDDGLCSLLVRDAESSDRGRYKCVASNPAGKVQSSAELFIECKLEHFLFVKSLTVILGMRSYPNEHLRWLI